MNSTNSLNGITFNGITLTAPPIHRQEEILTPEALDFIAALNRTTLLEKLKRKRQLGSPLAALLGESRRSARPMPSDEALGIPPALGVA